MTDLDAPRYLAGAVADAIGVESPKLNAWIKSGAVGLGKFDVDAEGQGSRRLFSLRRSYQLGVMAALVECGVTPRWAATHAIKFSDVGFGPSTGGIEHRDGAGRAPGELFATDQTYLVAAPGDDSAAIIPGRRLQPGWRGIALWLNPIITRVRARLGLNQEQNA